MADPFAHTMTIPPYMLFRQTPPMLGPLAATIRHHPSNLARPPQTLTFNPFSRDEIFDPRSWCFLARIGFLLGKRMLTPRDHFRMKRFDQNMKKDKRFTLELDAGTLVPYYPLGEHCMTSEQKALLEKQRCWWLKIYLDKTKREDEIERNREFLERVEDYERMVYKGVLERLLKVAREKKAKANGKRLRDEQEDDEQQGKAKRKRLADRAQAIDYDPQPAALTPSQFSLCRCDLEQPTLCHCGCGRLQLDYYYDRHLEQVPIRRAPDDSDAETVVMESAEDDREGADEPGWMSEGSAEPWIPAPDEGHSGESGEPDSGGRDWTSEEEEKFFDNLLTLDETQEEEDQTPTVESGALQSQSGESNILHQPEEEERRWTPDESEGYPYADDEPDSALYGAQYDLELAEAQYTEDEDPLPFDLTMFNRLYKARRRPLTGRRWKAPKDKHRRILPVKTGLRIQLAEGWGDDVDVQEGAIAMGEHHDGSDTEVEDL